jgi:hypothetical protein
MGEDRPHIPSPLLLSAHRTSCAYIKAHVLKLVGQARRREQARPRAMPNIPWSPWNRFTCTRSAPRPGGRPCSATARRSSPRTSTASRSYGCNRCKWTPTEGVVADRFARPDLVLRAGTGTATGRPTLCTTAANRHSQPACSPYPGRWQRLAGTSAYTAVRRRSVLRCSGRVNHQDPVMPPNLPGGKPGSGPPFGRKIQKRIDMGETAWGAARRNRTEGRSSVSTEQRENLGAILGQSALPVGSDVSEQRRLLRELISAQPPSGC